MSIYNEIARSINKNTKNSALKQVISRIELGEIKSTGLKLDTFKYEIQKYLIIESAGHLSAGDRVLVANIGDEFIVIGRIL